MFTDTHDQQMSAGIAAFRAEQQASRRMSRTARLEDARRRLQMSQQMLDAEEAEGDFAVEAEIEAIEREIAAVELRRRSLGDTRNFARRVVKAVAAEFGVGPETIYGDRRRGGDISTARHVTGYLMREITDWSYPRIGEVLHKHHTTVIYGHTQTTLRCGTDAAFKTRVAGLAAKLTQQQEKAA